MKLSLWLVPRLALATQCVLYASPAPAYCIYNKTNRFDVLISLVTVPVNADAGAPAAGRNIVGRRLKPGENYCCSASDKSCVAGSIGVTALEATLAVMSGEPRVTWRCGAGEGRTSIRFPVSGYLLVRQSRFDAAKPSALDNAHVAVDAMEVDGRLIRTIPCAGPAK